MRRFFVRLGLLGVGLCSQVGLADDEPITVRMKVPAKYRGYGLRVSGKPFELDQRAIKVSTTSSRRRLELSDADNRLMADSFTRVQPGTLVKMRERPLQAGVEMGFGFETGPSKLKKLRLYGATYHGGANLVYRPKAYGLMLNYHYLRFDGRREWEGADSDLQSNRLGVGAVYEWAPIAQGPLFFTRLHIAFMVGAMWATHRIQISEDDVELGDTARTIGPQAAIELRIPLAVNLWLSLREAYTSYQLNFSDLNFDENVQELNSSVGVRYAF